MSSVDVGDALELTFSTATGATVLLDWYNPAGDAELHDVVVAEDPADSGKYPYTLAPSTPGVWTAQFTASGAATAVERYYVRARAVVNTKPPLATTGDVAELYGPLGSQEALTAALLRHASRMIRTRIADVDDLIAAGDLDAGDVALAVVQMVLRVLRNPSGLKSETVGPFSRTFDTGLAAGMLAITPAELQLLTPASTDGATIAGTIWVRPGLAPPPTGTLGWRRVRGW